MIYNVEIFGIHLKLKPIAFTLFGWDIYWYGILIATGFALALVYAWKNAKRLDINLDRLLDVVIVTTPLAILCARAYYIIFTDGFAGFKNFFNFGSSGFSGLAIYGGVIGAAVIGAVMCKLRKVNLLSTLDLASIGFLIGQGLGRWGNFMNQEAFGGPTGSNWWGMTSENVANELGAGVLAHPCFLYESIWCFAGFFLLHFLSKKRKYSGQIALTYCAWYGFGRMIIEGFRTDSLYLFSTGIRVSQALSAALVIVSLILMAIIHSKLKAKRNDATYESVFGEMSDTVIEISDDKDQIEADTNEIAQEVTDDTDN